MCKNIELFDEYTAKIFTKLYQTFPVPQDFIIVDFIARGEVNDFGMIVDKKDEASSHLNVSSAHANVAWHTFTWLKETGFIKIEGEHHSLSLSGIVLTAKGLEVLKATPESLQPSKRIGDALIGLLKQGATESASQLIGQAIKLGTQ